MKMIMAILHKDDELETIEELNIAGYMVTKLATTGGFLKKKSTTIIGRKLRTLPTPTKIPSIIREWIIGLIP